MSEESTSGSNSNSSRGGRAILGFDSSDGSGDKNGPCWCFLGFIVITAAVTGGVVSSWPPADPSKSYTDRTVREAIVSDVPTSTVYLDYQYHPRQMVERRQHYSMNSTEDVISIVPLSHNMELASYCYTQNEHAMRCDLYFNNPDNFEYWKDDNQCLSYTIGAPKTTSKNNQCSFFPDDTDDVGKTPPCIKPNQIPLNICSQKISWDNTTCFNRKDTELFSGKVDLVNTRYTDSTFFQAVEVASPQDYSILQEFILGRSFFALLSNMRSEDDEINGKDQVKTVAICSNGVPGNGPQQNYKPMEASTIDKIEPSSSSNETVASSNTQS